MKSFPIGNRDLIRAINRSIILNVIKTRGPIGRAEVARLTALSPATVTAITADLINEGLVFEKEPGDSSGGRRPILLAINPTGAYVVGLKLMEDRLVGALTDLEASVVCKQTIPLGRDAGKGRQKVRSPEETVETIASLVESMLACEGVEASRLLGVGIGLAGIVDSEGGVLRKSPFLGWLNLPLRDLMQERLNAPVYIDNDVNTLTLAEQWFGAGQGVDDFLVITVGRGVGMGIVVNRQFYRGARGGAGELGHTVVDPQGPLCECGKRGCLETFVGDHGLLRMAGELLGKDAPLSTDELLALAEDGDGRAREVFSKAGQLLGLMIANLINLFNPQRVIISGEGARYGTLLFEPMRAAINQHALPALAEDAQVQVEPWGDDAWARGAASLVLSALFEPPRHGKGE